MFEYATFLNKNKIAVSHDFEEEPFKEREIVLSEKKDKMNKTLRKKEDLEQNAMRIVYLIQDLQELSRDKVRIC